jgi:hypothetical protein
VKSEIKNCYSLRDNQGLSILLPMIKSKWNEHLSVDAKIVKLLSSATYEDFPSALRELVSNSYDADATEVRIVIDLKNDLIEISDNGNGMTREEFGFFLRIAGQERERDLSRNFARKRIGQFGIGFLAIFPFGKQIRVSSTARRSDVRFDATIPSWKFIDTKGRVNVEEIPIPGVEMKDSSVRDEHGVTLRIGPLTPMVHRYFRPERADKKKKKKGSMTPMDKLRWTMQDDLPVNYREDSAYRGAFADIEDTTDFIVTLNGKKLLRNDPGSDILENTTWRYDGVACRYVIATNWKALPNEERGIKVRLNNVGVGSREFFGLGTETRTYSRLHWLTGEIRIIQGFDQLLNIDRAKFREGPEYDAFHDHFASRLRHFANQVEVISEAKRDIERQVKGSRVAEVGPRKRLIEKSLERLQERGFTVSRTNRTKSGGQPVTINLKKRTVEVAETEETFSDYITVESRQLPVVYSAWNPLDDPRAVRRTRKGDIEINQAYLLFRSKRYGEIFRRIFVIFLLAQEDGASGEKLQKVIAKKLMNEFFDIV